MNFHILTLFPEMVTGGLNTSILGRAAQNGHIGLEAVNIRDFTKNKHKKSGRLSLWRRGRHADAGPARF